MPVEQVSWNDAQEFIKKLNQRNDGLTYRLPTDAEWEYAARAGTSGDYAGPLDEMGWYANNSGRNYMDAIEENKKYVDWAALAPTDTVRTWRQFIEPKGHQPHPAGTKKPNAWGVYDMHGNVAEWVDDCWHDQYTAAAPTDGSAWLTGNCTGRILRGGSFEDSPEELRSAGRVGEYKDNSSFVDGLRIARRL
jgi:formylglycine-generating enzyme required for sulfatase activity